jgi:hypothetical protein
MLAIELFDELCNEIEFNGDVELSEVGVIWSLNFVAPELLEDEESLVPEEELVEALEEDLAVIKGIFKFYKEDVNFFEVEEFQLDGDLLFVEFVLVDLN